MDFEKLDSIVSSFVHSNSIYMDTLSLMVEYSEKVYKEPDISCNNEWSRSIDLNDSINIIYSFLKTIDLNIASQFINIINSKDKNNNPYVKFWSKSEHPNEENRLEDGIVHIYFDNTPNDMFIIIHEIFHKMNECVINDNNRTLETVARDYLGETVSVLSGFLLGNYLVDNGIITENDFSIRKARRLLDCKENARDVIIENELIKMKLNGKEINKDNALELLNSLDKDSITYEILLNEKNSLYIINDILKNNDLQLSIAQRYVMAWIFSNELLKRNTVVEDFIKLHTALGDENSYFDDICNKILNTEHHNKN